MKFKSPILIHICPMKNSMGNEYDEFLEALNLEFS